jgi:hypothetical protein
MIRSNSVAIITSSLSYSLLLFKLNCQLRPDRSHAPAIAQFRQRCKGASASNRTHSPSKMPRRPADSIRGDKSKANAHGPGIAGTPFEDMALRCAIKLHHESANTGHIIENLTNLILQGSNSNVCYLLLTAFRITR